MRRTTTKRMMWVGFVLVIGAVLPLATSSTASSTTPDNIQKSTNKKAAMETPVDATSPDGIDHHHHHRQHVLSGPSPEERARHYEERRRRIQAQRERAQAKINSMPPPDISKLEQLSPDKIKQLENERKLGWLNGNSNSGEFTSLADPSQYYDKWQQAYRMLGGYIDCDASKSDGSGDHRDLKSGDWNYDYNEYGCARWMIWAAYVDPNYQGQGYDEYFGDDPQGTLDCHNPDSEWELLGVYRQEFYQFIEQISKHLWAIDEYEYVVALAGLSYMTDYDCFYVGADSSGNSIWAGVAPQPYGKFQMALYTDDYCIEPDESLGLTYDDYGLTTDVQLSSQDGGDDDDTYSYAEEWWQDSQEYTLTQLNDVYESFKYCTSCVDYPTYQDGYFIGDTGTDDDDLINQCWKFYSHDTDICGADCISKGHSQGTMLSVKYGDTIFGKSLSDYSTYSSGANGTGGGESRWSRMLANAFVTFSFIVFVATFLAFAVARRSRHRERASGKSRRLLDDGDGRRSSSRGGSKGDGLFRSKSSERSKSGKSTRTSRSASKSRKSYDAPKSRSSKRSSSRSRKSSRRHVADDF
mmetsp:Transcript_33866/g.50225  ORF Transcript_33866/g.50225 Transcript_33866/m.50225 type:complete len:581 (-) Transcript_33866:420-2162(-)|eukprot:CAMPEP_0194049750 /NCGR_PEP_ID=MMETSP0009_2-20130614/30871_1 /TAXON_ID=210454 /ORGANISM="Grammatophora oceanica, Strain CCMP 410" /LENGTH=580 /DNA_ID=CAMNT_0038695969 /DNA_START=124 /DNA_END=1866 /DNA_ORIENTATION=-